MSIAVSVIIPAYNAQDLIGHAIRSVLKQTWQDFEIVVCDDGSTDATSRQVESLIRQDSRIRMLRNAANRGVSYARNAAIEAAAGDWIALLDADDYYHPSRLETLRDLARRHNADLVCDNVAVVPPNSNRAVRTIIKSGEFAESIILSGIAYIAKSSRLERSYAYLKPVIRKGFIERYRLGYDESLAAFEDFDFMARCLIKGGKCVLTEQAYYYYRLTPGSASRRPRTDWYELEKSIDDALLNMPEAKSNPMLVRALCTRKEFFRNIHAYSLISRWAKNGNMWRATKEFLVHLFLLPFFMRVFFANLARRIGRRREATQAPK